MKTRDEFCGGKRDEQMNKKNRWIGFGIVILLFVILTITFMDNSGANENIEENFDINVLSLEEQKDGSIYVTAEIVNDGDFTFEDNKIFIVNSSEESGEVTHKNKSAVTGDSGTSNMDDKQKNVDVKELSGQFNNIGPKKNVRIGFSIPYEQAKKESLLIMQSFAVKDGEMNKYITLTRPLNVSE